MKNHSFILQINFILVFKNYFRAWLVQVILLFESEAKDGAMIQGSQEAKNKIKN